MRGKMAGRILFSTCACIIIAASSADAAFWRNGLWVSQPQADSLLAVTFRVNRSDLSELQIGGVTVPCTDTLGSYDWTVTLTASETQNMYINNGVIDGSFQVASGPYEGMMVTVSGNLSGGRGELSIGLALNDTDMTHCEIVLNNVQVRRAGLFQRIVDILLGR